MGVPPVIILILDWDFPLTIQLLGKPPMYGNFQMIEIVIKQTGRGFTKDRKRVLNNEHCWILVVSILTNIDCIELLSILIWYDLFKRMYIQQMIAQ